MRYSQGYDPTYDMGEDKEVIKLSAIERSNGSWCITHNGRVLGDSRGMSRDAVKGKINDMCEMLYCCVVYVK